MCDIDFHPTLHNPYPQQLKYITLNRWVKVLCCSYDLLLGHYHQQTVLVSLMFLAIVSYVLGIFMETFIPRNGYFKWLNPVNCLICLDSSMNLNPCQQGPFNKKENAFIVIMASAAANSALGTEVLAVQRLYYNITPNAGSSVFLLFSSQLLGYGIGGMMRCMCSLKHDADV